MVTLTKSPDETADALRSLSKRLNDLEQEAAQLGVLPGGLNDVLEPQAPFTADVLADWANELISRRLGTWTMVSAYTFMYPGSVPGEFCAELYKWRRDLDLLFEDDYD